jgi:hypothetical protein
MCTSWPTWTRSSADWRLTDLVDTFAGGGCCQSVPACPMVHGPVVDHAVRRDSGISPFAQVRAFSFPSLAVGLKTVVTGNRDRGFESLALRTSEHAGRGGSRGIPHTHLFDSRPTGVRPVPASTSVRGVRAENLIHAGQAAWWYSWRVPPRRSWRRMSRWAICPGSVIGSGSARRGAALWSVRWVRCSL